MDIPSVLNLRCAGPAAHGSGADALGHFQMGDVKENIPTTAPVYLQLPRLITFLRGEELQQKKREKQPNMLLG